MAESPEWVTPQSAIDSNMNTDSAGDRVIVNPSGTPGIGSDVKSLKNSAGQVVAYVAVESQRRVYPGRRGRFRDLRTEHSADQPDQQLRLERGEILRGRRTLPRRASRRLFTTL